MLKIKDNVDLKELEKFGITPRYDELTGKIKKYKKQHDIEIHYCDNDHNHNPYWYIQAYCDLNILYDLIKADLVEKVEDK